MKVKELIESLGEFDPEDEVHFAYNSGDHWRTTVAPKVRSVDYQAVKYSEYHRLPTIVDLYDEEGEPLDISDSTAVVIMS